MQIDGARLVSALRHVDVPASATRPVRFWLDPETQYTVVLPTYDRMSAELRAALAVQGIAIYRRAHLLVLRTDEGDEDVITPQVAKAVTAAIAAAEPIISEATDGKGIDQSDRMDVVDRCLLLARRDPMRFGTYWTRVVSALRQYARRPPALPVARAPREPREPKSRAAVQRDYQAAYRTRRDETASYVIEQWLADPDPAVPAEGRHRPPELWDQIRGHYYDDLMTEWIHFLDRRRRGLESRDWQQFSADNWEYGFPDVQPVPLLPRQFSSALWARCRDETDNRFRRVKSCGIEYVEVAP